MLAKKKKFCAGCETEQYIWKNISGKKYCKSCAGKVDKPAKISTKSDKQKAIDKAYSLMRAEWLLKNPFCKPQISVNCTKQTTDVHHMAGRGIMTLAQATWLPVCRNCHDYIHANPQTARDLGYLQ